MTSTATSATAVAIVSYVPWASPTMKGARVTMTGTAFQDDSDIKITSAAVADVNRRAGGDVDLLILCLGDNDPAAQQREISEQLIAAATSPQRKGCGMDSKPLTQPDVRNALFADLRRHDEWARNGDDDNIEEWAYSSQALLARVEALPNISENLALRARAIGSGCDNTEDLGNLDLEELAAHAHGTVGRLIRQLLVGVSLPGTVADRCVWDAASAAVTAARAADDLINARYEAADDAGKAELGPEWERVGDLLYDAEWALFEIPAPDHAALAWKAERLFGECCDQDRCCQAWSPAIVANYMTDVRRLLSGEGC